LFNGFNRNVELWPADFARDPGLQRDDASAVRESTSTVGRAPFLSTKRMLSATASV
jgi:hypothetical protein